MRQKNDNCYTSICGFKSKAMFFTAEVGPATGADADMGPGSYAYADDDGGAGAGVDPGAASILLCHAIVEMVTRVMGGAGAGVWGCSRGEAPVARSRQFSMYLAHVVCGLNFTQIGLVFARDRTTVSHACRLIEDRRDDPFVDRALDCLEHSILCLLDTGFYYAAPVREAC